MLDSGIEAPSDAANTGLVFPLSAVEARMHIDDLDIGIISLLRIRREMSRRIQQARLQAGGPQADLGREADIARTYCSRFGESGNEIAAAVLRVCRS